MKILFIPTSSAAGAGEYIRSLTIAQKIRQTWPDANLQFILNRHAKYIKEVPFPVQLIEQTPTLSVDAVKQIIQQENPELCIFDSSGRTTLFSWLKSRNTPVIYVSSRNNTRRKAFRFRWLRLINQHWIVQPLFANGPLTPWETFKLKVTGARHPEFLQTVYPEYDSARQQAFKNELGIGDKKYLLFSSGGGGKRGDGPQAPEIFAEAAARVAARTGKTCVALMGPNYPGSAPEHLGVIALKSVSNEHFIDLLQGADMLVTGGGSSLAQGMAERKLMVCAPAAADQGTRLDAAAKTFAIKVVETDVDSLSNAVIELIEHPDEQNRLYRALDELNLENGLKRVAPLLRQILSD